MNNKSSILQDKKSFLVYSTKWMGGLSAVGLVWQLGELGGPWFWLLLIAVGFGGGLLWGWLMWHLFVSNFRTLQTTRTSSNSEKNTG